MIKNFLKSRTFRQGTMATAFTAIGVALIVVLNLVVSMLADRYPLSADLTENKLFGISQESKDFLAGLTKDITIYVLNTEESFIGGNTYAVQANEVIKKYEQESQRVKLEYIDLIRNPGFASRYPELQLNTNSILVTCGDKVRDLTPYDLYNVEYDQQSFQEYISSSKAEQAMTSAMLNVTSDEVTSATFITGHDETELPGFESLLTLNNYDVIKTNLLTEEIPADAKVAIMAAPKRDLSEEELDRLDVYLSNGEKLGHTLLYLASIEAPEPEELPNLSAFLADWGIEVRPSVVFESSLNKVSSFNLYAPYTDYTEDVYSETTKSRNLMVFMPFSKPMSALFETKSATAVSTLLQFSETAGIVPVDAGEGWQPRESDLSGPIPALILAQETAYEGTTPMRSNVLAAASVFSVSDEAISSTGSGNGDYFLGLLNTLCEREDVVSIQSKSIASKTLGLQSGTSLLFALLFVVLIPLAVVVLGVTVWLKRRHR